MDEEDYGFWKTLFGLQIFQADGNLNGVVDAADYTVWRDHLGQSIPISADEEPGSGSLALTAVVVPEPASMLLALGLGGLFFCRRHRAA